MTKKIPNGSWAPNGWTPLVIRLNRFLSGHFMALVAITAAAGLICEEHNLDATDRSASSAMFNGPKSLMRDLSFSNWLLRKLSKSETDKELMVCTQNSKSLGSSRGASRGESA